MNPLRVGRRRFLILAPFVALVLIVGAWLALDRASALHGYKMIDDYTIVVQTISGTSDWTRLSAVVEKVDSVGVEVRTFSLPFAASTGDDLTWIVVRLNEPLGERPVVDSSSGQTLTAIK